MSRRLWLLLIATLVVGGVLVGLTFWPGPHSSPAPPATLVQASPDNRVQLNVSEFGFEPQTVRVQAGKPVTLVVTRQTDDTCATELVIPDAGVRIPLPLHVAVTVTFVPTKTGRLRYGCGMQMMVSGVLLVE
jgi:plastocyanin domain-containing protein